MSAPTLDAPRSRRQLTKNNFELNAWLFMRISGVVLIILVLGHLLIMNILDGVFIGSTSHSLLVAGQVRSGRSGTC